MWDTIKKSNFYAFELFCLFRLASNTIGAHAQGMLTQDKICLVTYEQSGHFCQNIQLNWNTTEQQHMRDDVLAAASRFGNYRSMLEFIPMLLWALFVGSFLDSTVFGVFVVMAMQVASSVIGIGISLVLYFNYHSSPYLMLLSSVSMFFSGGMVSFISTAYRYLTIRTAEAERAFKFLILEAVIVIGLAGAILLGGQLTRNTDRTSERLRTYQYNFFVSLALDSVAVLLIVFIYFRDRPQLKEKASNSNEESSNRERSILSLMFNVDNVRQTMKCFFKRRAQNVRLQVFILYIALFVSMMVTTGASGVMMGFVQKVYHWSPTTSSNFTALKQIVSMVLLGAVSTILIKWLKVSDSVMIILSQVSSLANDVIVGTFLFPAAYYISLPVGSLAWLGMTAIRSKMSKIIPEDEIGKVFSFSSTVDAIMPFVASTVYTNLFAVSIGPYPGAIYHFGAVLMAVAIVAMVFEIYYCPVKSLADLRSNEHEDEEKEEHEMRSKTSDSISNSQINQI